MLDLEGLLYKAKDEGASDIHLKTGNPPILRVDGELGRVEGPLLTADDMETALASIASHDEIERFKKDKELDTGFSLQDVVRFRVNVCQEQGDIRIVLRLIPMEVSSIEGLNLPKVLDDVCNNKNGIILVTGPTGSGKSTTIAAMIDKINSTRADHIVTIEDPIEFVHKDKTGIVSQRQVGIDTESFKMALRAALRQDPDVIFIGEMRDAETVETALSSAETGHLVFSTLHTVNAVETLTRIMDFFPPYHQEPIRKMLASVLRGIVSQRLVSRLEGGGRTVAAEVLIGNLTVREYLMKGAGFGEMTKLMEDGYSTYGMQTFDQALYDLWKSKTISEEEALENATSPKDLKLRMEGLTGG
jgi:twitching motility protein PilT